MQAVEARQITSTFPLARLLHASFTPLFICKRVKEHLLFLLHASYMPLTRLLHASFQMQAVEARERASPFSSQFAAVGD
jgi:hypothetical protein